ncbi:MAG: macro domain-containing protein, partial [Candidatus Poribacteria bacterium]|nr:macro domain-containing protein [Candidatus Poribacteria bacterium]
RQISVIPEPHMFFQPGSRTQIGNNVSLVDGDMFFSTMHTLTISVNLQGVMGKGLASRAKYQFPDVYVEYQDACRARKITATRPYLYKRETSLDYELADPSLPLSTPNAVKWFLLFATKRKWRENSRLDDIEAGLDWVKGNYKKEKIESLAMPALGCGLGNLSWADVGPLMCKYLHGLEIQVAIYLPREHETTEQYLDEAYLLGNQVNRPSSSAKQLAFF